MVSNWIYCILRMALHAFRMLLLGWLHLSVPLAGCSSIWWAHLVLHGMVCDLTSGFHGHGPILAPSLLWIGFCGWILHCEIHACWVRHFKAFGQWCWLGTCRKKSKPIPGMGLCLFKDEALTLPGWEEPHVVELPPCGQLRPLRNHVCEGLAVTFHHW